MMAILISIFPASFPTRLQLMLHFSLACFVVPYNNTPQWSQGKFSALPQ